MNHQSSPSQTLPRLNLLLSKKMDRMALYKSSHS